MKKITILLISILLTQVSFAAQSNGKVVTTPISNMSLGHPHFVDRVVGGKITVDFQQMEVEVSLNQKYVCQVEACPAVMPAPIVVTLPIVEVDVNSTCGETVYIAEIDQRPVDGALNKMVVTDFTTMFCDIYLENQLQVEYLTVFPGSNSEFISTFWGGAHSAIWN